MYIRAARDDGSLTEYSGKNVICDKLVMFTYLPSVAHFLLKGEYLLVKGFD